MAALDFSITSGLDEKRQKFISLFNVLCVGFSSSFSKLYSLLAYHELIATIFKLLLRDYDILF